MSAEERIAELDLKALANQNHQIYMAGYKVGYEAGYADGMRRIMDMVEAAVAGPKLPEISDAPV